MAAATRAAIRHGQRLFRAGQLPQAADQWREALAEAYASEDFAGMFVLTKNLGEASLALALAVGASTEAKTAGLQDAVKYFRYALGLVDQCELWDAVQAYGALQASVARVESQLVKAERRLAAVEAEEKAAVGDVPAEERPEDVEAASKVCSTCEQIPIGSELVLDDADGCFYCVDCFEEYYASLRPVVQSPSTEEEQRAEGEQSNAVAGNGGQPGDAASVDADIVEETIVLATPSEAPIKSQEEPPLTVGSPASTGEALPTGFTHNHTARVELGSLADVLRQSQAQDDDSLSESAPAGSVSGSEDVQASDDECLHEELPLETEQRPSPAVRYTIQELLEVRRLVPTDVCPAGLELLPVHKSNQTNKQPASSVSRSSKSSSAPKPVRTAIPAAAKTITEHKRLNVNSALPSLEMVDSCREAQRTDLSGAPAVEALASVLFDDASPNSVALCLRLL